MCWRDCLENHSSKYQFTALSVLHLQQIYLGEFSPVDILLIIISHYYMAVSHKDWELLNSRI